jgi:aspartate racemase
MNSFVFDGGLEHPKRQCVRQIFDQQAYGRPDSVALICDRDALTYSQLNARANQLAHHLRFLGVGPNTLVGICVARSINMAIGILGILKAGGAWVPVDEAYPAERQSLVFKDARISILVSEEAIACKLAPHSIKTVLLDCDWNSISKCSTSEPEPVTFSGSLAYVMYTSGSTGQPKGVMITHGNLCHYLRAMQRRLGISERDVYLHTASIAFSSSVRQLMVPLTSGAKVVVAKPEDIREPLVLFRKIRDQRISVIDIVPSYWRTCIDALSDLDISERRRLLKNDLRLILTASEILPADLPARWRSEVGHPAQLINMFGQTETTGIVATYKIPDTNNRESKTVPIGYPIDETRIYVLDDHLHEVPADTVGELYVAGPGVGAGYLNQTETTAERFVRDPFKRTTFERLYRTGDLGRCRSDGSLEFVGRVDYQVKIRGIRIELQEIESALHAHPAVKEAIVVATQNEPNQQRIVAYFVPAAGSFLTMETLRSFLAEKLPEFMIPTAFVKMDSLPRLPNGKLDRLRLPAPSQCRPQFEHSMVAPRNVTELKLAKIWQAVLVVAGIGVMDNFFDLGGNSLAALCLLAQVDKVFGKKLPPMAIFHAPTIEQMAQLLYEDGVASSSALCALQTHGSKPPFFWIHGEISNAFLPRYLAPDQPVYALMHQSEDGTPARFTTVESIASAYLREIRAVQPTGPYFLGGFCFGGLVAFEIAQQLKAAGDEVGLLAFFEPRLSRANGSTRIVSVSSSPSIPSRTGLLEDGLRHLRVARRLRGGDRVAYIWPRLRSGIMQALFRSRPANYARNVICLMYHRLGLPLPYSLRSFYLLRIYRQATRQYELRKYPGSLDLFLHPATPEEGSPHSWSSIASGNVEVHELPEGHEEILKEPYVRIWADSLKACLSRAQAAQEDQVSPKAF